MNPHYSGYSGAKVLVFKKGMFPSGHFNSSSLNCNLRMPHGLSKFSMPPDSWLARMTDPDYKGEVGMMNHCYTEGTGKNMSGIREPLGYYLVFSFLWKTSLEDNSSPVKGPHSGSDSSVRRLRNTSGKKGRACLFCLCVLHLEQCLTHIRCSLNIDAWYG